MGYDRRTALVAALVVVVQLGLAVAVQRLSDAGHVAGSWWAIGLLAFFVGAVLAHWCAMAIHECSHDLGAKTPTACVAPGERAHGGPGGDVVPPLPH